MVLSRQVYSEGVESGHNSYFFFLVIRKDGVREDTQAISSWIAVTQDFENAA